ncbi:radical SAM protein [Streptomyces nigrescens]|uniref:Radical SAM protein n=1 Tax=Streptomyces nigrescens TaxID=1920 RepID=A0ABY7IYT3_STRNI|nr:radical SAM protein [Streptomyces nigrescens]WAU03998.1 radical SAM protein [Streptomyces nigrescens]
MLDQIAGISRVRMLYLQLLYRCNFSCKHCFHGELLKDAGQFSLDEASGILDHFREVYKLEAVTLLGGEPLLYPYIDDVCSHAKHLGLRVEICTNGHRGYHSALEAIAPQLDKLRISLDGLKPSHDAIRKRGSFDGAMEMIDLAVTLEIATGATMTVTEHNLNDVVPLARLLQDHGVTELKLHALRLVGNAAANPSLEVSDPARYRTLHQQISDAGLSISILYDSDLSQESAGERCSNLVADGWLDRIESDPRGGLTVSCKAVGRDVNAFRWDKARHEILYEPRANDEFATRIPDVIYESTKAS